MDNFIKALALFTPSREGQAPVDSAKEKISSAAGTMANTALTASGNPLSLVTNAISALPERSSGESDSDFVNRVAEAVKIASNVAGNTNPTIEVKDDGEVEIEPAKDEAKDEAEIEYTYKPGDTLGQVLLDLGLSDADNLWGPGKDVDYYTNQLHNQGIYGNVPIGTTIKLKRRASDATKTKANSSVKPNGTARTA